MMSMLYCSAVLLVICFSYVSCSSEAAGQMDFKFVKRIAGKEELEKFISPGSINVVFFLKKEKPQVKTFFKLLEKSADYLNLYKVQVGVFDCTAEGRKDVEQCDRPRVDQFIYTYKFSKELLSLELETMFDVNSIMSNILQLVLLREVPIIQDPQEVKKYLEKRKGKVNVIFGYMKAIGTQEHRIFMEVAYAYQDKFNFCVCTDRKATVNFIEPPNSKQKSAIWLIQTKDMTEDENDFNSIRFQDKLSLTSFAKFAKAVTLPKIFDIPKDGLKAPYMAAILNIITFYYRPNDREDIMYLADLVNKHCQGNFGIISIDVENSPDYVLGDFRQDTPTMSVKYHDENFESFISGELTTDSMVDFVDEIMTQRQSRQTETDTDDGPVEEKKDMMDDEPDSQVNIGDVETEDDSVADVVHQTRKIPMMLDRVPALTDKTFPTTIAESKTILTLFYFPFTARSMAFLRIVGDSVEMAAGSEVKVARVNCYDWTDVCGAQNITIYPTLRIFQDGEAVRDYKGPMDVQSVYATIKLLELSMPVMLESTLEVDGLLAGVMPPDLNTLTNVTILGIFDEKQENEKMIYQKAVKLSQENALFASIVTIEAKQLASKFKTRPPALILSKLDDTVEPYVVFDEDFTVESIHAFVQEKKLPKLTELTALRFPDLYNRGHPFVILFTDGTDDCKLAEDSLRKIIKAGQHSNISFTLMPVPDLTSLGFTVLNTYSTDPVIPTISYVNFKQGQVFNFDGDSYPTAALTLWLASITKGEIAPSTMLTEGEWKPLNKGYDFLELEAKERKESREKAIKNRENQQESQGSEAVHEVGGSEGESERPRPVEKPDILTFEEESDTRDELLELHSSRLYHHGDRDKASRKHKDGEKEAGHSEQRLKDKIGKGTNAKQEKHDEL